MTDTERGHRFNVRMSEEELKKLHALAEHEGISASDYLRLYVRRSYAEVFGEPQKSQTKKRRLA